MHPSGSGHMANSCMKAQDVAACAGLQPRSLARQLSLEALRSAGLLEDGMTGKGVIDDAFLSELLGDHPLPDPISA